MKAIVRRLAILVCAVSGIAMACCSAAPVTGGGVAGRKLADGVYSGYSKKFPNNAEVEVTVKDGAIAAVKVLFHGAWKGKGIEEIIAGRIVAAQSTKVDAVTGATNSSAVIMNAAEEAVKKALLK